MARSAGRSARNPVIRLASGADLDRFYDKGDVRLTMRAYVGLLHGRPIGVGGLVYVDGKVFVFCDLKPKARRFKVAIVRLARRIMADAEALGHRRLYADVDPEEPMAERWLMSLGFAQTDVPGLMMWRK